MYTLAATMPDQKAELLDPNSIQAQLHKMKPEMEAALPRHITADRMARIALTALRLNPKLFRSTRESFFGSLITASTIGLEPNVLGRAFLVPYFNKKEGVTICQLIPGWRGHMDLVSRAGKAAAWTGAVYDGDFFEWGLGDRPFVKHVEGKWTGVEKALMYTYSCGRQNGIEWPNIEVWPVDKIIAHRNKYNRVGDQHYSYRDWEMYARKIPLLQVIKYLPASVEMVTAQTLDWMGSEGRQRLTIDMSLKGDIGESDAAETQVERYMEQFDWNEDQRKSFREAYEGRPDAALEYLKNLEQKLDPGQRQPEEKKADKPKTKAAEKTEEPKSNLRPDLGNGEGVRDVKQDKPKPEPAKKEGGWW